MAEHKISIHAELNHPSNGLGHITYNPKTDTAEQTQLRLAELLEEIAAQIRTNANTGLHQVIIKDLPHP